MSQVATEPADRPDLMPLARRIAEIGGEIGLPFVGVTADIGSPEPMRDAQGRPFTETIFRWIDPALEYWKDRAFGLRAPFVTAVRYMAEPFYYHQGRFASWRPSHRLDGIEVEPAARAFGITGSIIAPVFLPYGIIGVVVWAASEPVPNLPQVFEARAAELHNLAIRFIAAYHDDRMAVEPVRLTKREIQCLKWAAAGKTDQEIARIIDVALPTVRFHVRNAAEKLGAPGRGQAIQRAASLGYIGAPPPG